MIKCDKILNESKGIFWNPPYGPFQRQSQKQLLPFQA
jgi:hypothetical protein